MLLTSPGDNGSSLPSDSLLLRPPERSLDDPTSIEGDRVTTSSPLEGLFDGDYAPIQPQAEPSSIDNRSSANAPIRSGCLHSAKITSPGTQKPLRPTTRAQASSSQESDLDGLYALRQAATLKTLRQSRTRSWSLRSLGALTELNAAESTALFSFAAPLSPLRERDFTALSELFLRDDISAIEADVSQRLVSLLPEPCWEDHVFDFLKEFL